ncbi:unnamed protein product [Umbelopsis vinacea]
MSKLYQEVPLPSVLDVEKPNIIIFMPDQLRRDSLGCFGNKHVKTPNIDRFATMGTSFTNCFLQASVCSQSRCSIFTGQYPHIAGHRSLENLIKPWEPNLFRSLKENGYHVACLGPRGDTFAPTVTELSVTEYGFLVTPDVTPKFAGNKDAPPDEDVWGRLFYKGSRDSSAALDYDEAVVRSAETWLKTPPKQPWVLFLPLIFPHCPFQVEEPYFSMYNREDMEAPAQVEQKTGYEPRYMPVIRERYGTNRVTTEMWAEICATYYGMISRLDDQFGRILSLVEGKVLWEKTISLFFTDHGEYLGGYGLIEKWPSGLSDSLVKEPLIIGGAGLPSGKINDAMSEMVDLIPTLFQLCGIGEHFPHNGKSLVPTILHGVEHKEFAFSEGGFLKSEEPLLEQAPYPNKGWTYIYRLYEPAELYSRADDPRELHNLVADLAHLDIARTMESAMFKWLVETSDFLPWKKDPRFPEVKLESPLSQLRKRLSQYREEND